MDIIGILYMNIFHFLTNDVTYYLNLIQYKSNYN
jgi:hypothetical protein